MERRFFLKTLLAVAFVLGAPVVTAVEASAETAKRQLDASRPANPVPPGEDLPASDATEARRFWRRRRRWHRHHFRRHRRFFFRRHFRRFHRRRRYWW
jgi:hypothetical protein